MKNRYSTLFAVSVLAIFTLTLISNPFAYVLAQEGEKQADNNENLKKLLDVIGKTEEYIKRVFTQLEEDGLEITDEAKASYEMGLNITELASQSFNEGRIEETKVYAIDAMKYFRESMRQLKESDLAPSVPATKGILQAIDRGIIYIERLETMTEKVSETGYDTSAINERIEHAKEMMNNASNQVNEGMIEQSVKTLGEAKQTIAGVIGELNRLIRPETQKQLGKFSEQAITRLTEIEMKTDELLSLEEAERVKAFIERAKHHINRARIHVNQENYKSAIDELEKMAIETENGDKELNNKLPSAKRELRSWLLRLNGSLDEFQDQLILVENREDITIVQEKLINARDLTQEISKYLDAGDLLSASRALGILGGKVIDIDGDIHELFKNRI